MIGSSKTANVFGIGNLYRIRGDFKYIDNLYYNHKTYYRACVCLPFKRMEIHDPNREYVDYYKFATYDGSRYNELLIGVNDFNMGIEENIVNRLLVKDYEYRISHSLLLYGDYRGILDFVFWKVFND